MGQRSQIVLISAGVHYNNNNPNDNEGKIYISHNQWRYGTNAIYVLKYAIDKYNKLIKQDINKGEYFFSRIDEIFNNCLKYAENQNINFDLNQSHPFEDNTKEFYEYNKINFDFKGFLNNYTDNNNGWFIIEVMKDRSLKLAIINGEEESEEIKQRDFKEYCKFFGEIDEEDKINIKELEKYKRFDVGKDSQDFFNKIKKEWENKVE